MSGHLADALEAAALLEALEIRREGGLTSDTASAARARLAAAPYADVLQFGGNRQQIEQAFAATAHALGVQANTLSGVKFAGRVLHVEPEGRDP